MSTPETNPVLNEGPSPATPTRIGPMRTVAPLIAWGLFATSFSQLGVIGLYPFRFLLKDHLGLDATMVALFTQLANLPWNVKIFAGLVADGVPIFGTRRRHYLILSSVAAGGLWLAVGMVRPAYLPLLIMATAMNVALVFASTVSGGLLVQAGQENRATGRLSALRVIATNIAMLGTPLGALLAARVIEMSAVVAAIPMFLLAGMAWLLLHEGSPAKRDPRVWRNMGAQLRNVFRSRTLWVAAGLLFLVQFAPGFVTPLFYYQTNTLKFSEDFIGLLALISALSGAAGGFLYGYFCQRYRLRTLLYGSIIVTALAALMYLYYDSWKLAMVIEGAYAFVWYLAQLPLYDLAARATPKGSEALGYSLIVSAWNWGLFVSDITGSWLFDHHGWSFKQLVWLNAITTAVVLVVVPFLPGRLVDRTEAEESGS